MYSKSTIRVSSAPLLFIYRKIGVGKRVLENRESVTMTVRDLLECVMVMQCVAD